MRSGKAEKILNISKTTLHKKIQENSLKIDKTSSGENIFRWRHIAKLRYIHDFSGKKNQPFILSICQNKGGVGKTTSTINLATVYSYIGRTLVIDLDSQANLSQSFNNYSVENDITLPDVFNDISLVNNAIIEVSENLHIIPNSLKMERWKRNCREIKDVSFLLRKIIKLVREHYDFILIDTPPALDVCLELSIYASDYCVIPFEPQPFSLEGIENILEEIKFILDKDTTTSFDLKILGIFVTMYEKGKLAGQITDVINRTYENAFHTHIRKAVAVQQAQALKESIFDYDETSTVAFDYYNLAFEILERILK